MDLENKKIDDLWNKEAYFQTIEDYWNSGDKEAAFFSSKIADLIKKNGIKTVLDVGSGEGAIVLDLAKSTPDSVQYHGIDVAEVGIIRSQKRGIKNASFVLYDGNKIPFTDGFFELVFSTFVFEHLTEPERVFAEMSRVVKKNGLIVIACPNYGSPFFRSPCNKQAKISLLFGRLAKAFLPTVRFKTGFQWDHVDPIILKKDEHIVDYDTTIEPNLLFFKKFIEANGKFQITEMDSFWSKFKYGGKNFGKGMFLGLVAYFGRKDFPVVKYFGPFFYVVLRKTE